jgi:TetR/AcrR family transcriptional regulator, ethionamide resistance regulator
MMPAQMPAEAQPVAAPADRRTQARMSRKESRRRIVEAATDLVRQRSYADLSVDAVMREAGIGRTIFYRHFDDLGDLLLRVSREAVLELFEAQRGFVEARNGEPTDAVRRSLEAAVEVYQRHGPLLRAVAEAAAGDEQIAAEYAQILDRFSEFAEHALRDVAGVERADLAETARALNLMNATYLADSFGREPRVSSETAVRTLTEIWDAVIHR